MSTPSNPDIYLAGSEDSGDSDNSGDSSSIVTEGTEYKIVNRNSGYVIDVIDGLTDDGSNVQQWEDNGYSCQHWTFEETDTG
jgi:hypothetical protein